eukprot:Nitzschia sp. Nitz4//scaffold102_size76354//6470//9105//NITZ4_005623-RA/size76354-snap-gene-0.132-mRNA-1//-1//CDS//3329532222//5346//frame0
MDDSDNVCPLCCEELDISDQQFFPCKCGYQVCMWCWHRIRESESGLCPACRTPYGDDPHEFSAVDVEEVLKANKEKEAAAKRERERQRHQSDGNSSDGEGIAALVGPNMKGPMEVPKDRTQLANMRVIRRNLVYAVGLPPPIASEDTLRKPEYFGQYGRISKIVLNRSQTAGGDLRRASASAYVTFLHKEDTLACILALDGFYMDGRNIRASYGTSKYCSAFIKNVRCNNPECTYLHQMGDVEDTFTKQEIQAGYVTSGRDVLARQQQIVQQALSAVGSSGRRKTGSGGPSGTGRASAHPVFPPPTFDEPAKPSPPLVPPPPGPSATRSASVPGSSAFPTIAAAQAPSVPAPTPAPMARAASVGVTNPAAPKAPVASTGQISSRKTSGPAGTISAASVVAGVHSVSNEPPAPHTTLTSLTPLKRSAGKGTSRSTDNLSGANQSATTKLTGLRTGNKKNNGKVATAPGSPGSQGSQNMPTPPNTNDVSSIGGDIIATPVVVPPPAAQRMGVPMNGPSALSSLGGEPLSDIGGEVFNGPLKSTKAQYGAPIGSGKDKWNAGIGGDPVAPPGNSNLWGSGNPGAPGGPQGSQVGGTVIGGGTIGSSFQGNGNAALASILGITTPTGPGSLLESSGLWGKQGPSAQPPIAALNGNSVPVSGLIGGVAIGGPDPLSQNQAAGGGSKSDIALLQSLLPGVHITSGSAYNQGSNFGAIGGGNDWNSAPGAGNQRPMNPNMHQQHPQQQQWNGGFSAMGGQPVGAIGRAPVKQQQSQRQAPGNIW